jgi:Flp pilus assembly protein TadG
MTAKFNRRNPRFQRRGTITAMSALMAVVVCAMAAFGIDIAGYLVAKTELQRSADSAVMAACWEYHAKRIEGFSHADAMYHSRTVAIDYAALNTIGSINPELDRNSVNNPDGDIVFGIFNDFGAGNVDLIPDASGAVNAIRVTVRKSAARNGEFQFRIAPLFGITSHSLEATSTAAMTLNIRGFRGPGAQNLDILPFAIKETDWQNLLNGVGQDQWTWDAQNETVTAGSDGVVELNMFPHVTGSSGNSGTIDIGPSNNSTSDLNRQILEGVSQEDLDHIGGKLELDENGQLVLNGDTGISAGMKAALTSIIGKPRVICVYSSVSGNGNNANFVIIKFVGIRIMEVDFKGGKNTSKRVIIQPAPIVARFVIPSSDPQTSDYIYSPVVLVK